MDEYLESLVMKDEESAVEEQVVQEIEEALVPDTTEPEVEEKAEPEPVVEEAKPEPEKKVTLESNSTHSEGETVTVKDIRIFNVPDIKTASKIYSGNVIIKSRVANMYLLEYIKPGFGLVKGYTPDLK